MRRQRNLRSGNTGTSGFQAHVLNDVKRLLNDPAFVGFLEEGNRSIAQLRPLDMDLLSHMDEAIRVYDIDAHVLECRLEAVPWSESSPHRG